MRFGPLALPIVLAAVAPVGAAQSILVYDNDTVNNWAQTAATNLFPGTTTVGTAADFNTLLTGSSWDAVLIDCPNGVPVGGWTDTINYISGGGGVAMSFWDWDNNAGAGDFALNTAMEVTPVADISFSTQTLSEIPGAHSLYTGCTVPVSDWGAGFFDDGDEFTTLGSAFGAGEVGNPATPAVVIGNGGNTIAMYCIDESGPTWAGDGSSVQFWENCLAQILVPGPPGPPNPPPTPGPCYNVTTIPNAFSSIATTGTDITGLLSALDDGGTVVPMGITFDLYGASSSSIALCTNGYLTTGGDLTDFTQDCPMANPIDPNGGIYPYFSDLRLNEHGTMQHQTTGTVFTAQWTDVGSFDDSSASVTMQVRLDSSDDSVEFHYSTMDSGTSGTYDATGGEGSTGLEDATGANATEINCNTTGVLGSTVAFRMAPGTPGTAVVRTGSCPNPFRLTTSAGPSIGNDLVLRYHWAAGSLADVVTVDIFGAMLDIPTVFGCVLCNLPTDPARILIQATPASGTNDFTVPVPNDVTLIGAPVCFQGASVTGVGPLVIEAANALDTVIGDC